LACLIAICMGYEKIILCGMPMDFRIPHFFNNYPQVLDPINLHIYHKSWEYALNRLPTFRAKIRSCSGNTLLMLGRPTLGWLCDNQINESNVNTLKMQILIKFHWIKLRLLSRLKLI
jgi:hypothetical protein